MGIMAASSTGVREQKLASPDASHSPSLGEGMGTTTKWKDSLAELKYTFLTLDGWIGDYVLPPAYPLLSWPPSNNV